MCARAFLFLYILICLHLFHLVHVIVYYFFSPLWYPRYDGIDSMDFFVPFAGWESVLIKQTGGDTYLCGISQVDSDYMEDDNSSSTNGVLRSRSSSSSRQSKYIRKAQ